MSDGDLPAPTELTVLGFTLAGRSSGFDIGDVQEVLQMVELTAVPDAPGYVIGAMNLRGSVLPVIDLATMVGLEPEPYTLETPIVVVKREGRSVGLVVDDVHDVVDLTSDDVDEPSDLFPVRRVLSGVARTDDGLMMLFDLDRVWELAADGTAMDLAGDAHV